MIKGGEKMYKEFIVLIKNKDFMIDCKSFDTEKQALKWAKKVDLIFNTTLTVEQDLGCRETQSVIYTGRKIKWKKTSASNIMNEMMSSRARQAKVRADRLELQRAHQKELDLRLR